jgi:hypothetical protein
MNTIGDFRTLNRPLLDTKKNSSNIDNNQDVGFSLQSQLPQKFLLNTVDNKKRFKS